MLRSMFTAVSALNLHQSYLDVIADNLANANTPGFKASRILFQDQIAQLMSPASGPTPIMGGKNPTQVGMGVQIGSTLSLFTQGTLQATGRNQDVSIQGDGFLLYKSTQGTQYSREGSLSLDAAGYLVNSSTGHRVQGWKLDPITGTIDMNTPVNDIQAEMNRSIAKATANATVTGNLNPKDVTSPATITFNVYDSLGAPQEIKVSFTHSNTDPSKWGWTATPTPPAGFVDGVNPSGTLKFDTDGQIILTDPTDLNYHPFASITLTSTTGATNTKPMILDFKNITALTTGANHSDVAMTYQDGVVAGRVTDLSIEPNSGRVILQFSNGLSQALGQLALARFNNPTGLLRKGNTSFAESLSSGSPNVGAATTGGRGSITAGYLEGSNVDMANEFTNMILAQRGFQAQTRVITTSDEMLQELVNLKR